MYSNGSYVALAKAICPICGLVYETGEILFHRHCRKVFPKSGAKPFYRLCDEHQAKYNKGYVALIGCSNGQEGLKIHEANRTGLIAFVPACIWPDIFGTEAPLHRGQRTPFVYCSDEVIKEIINEPK